MKSSSRPRSAVRSRKRISCPHPYKYRRRPLPSYCPLSTSMTSFKLPSWHNLPPVPGMPHGTAWGLFDKNAVKDELGTLNLLTPETVIEAGDEIKTGKSVAMNWGLEKLHNAGFGRKALVHNFVDWRVDGKGFYCFDDEVEINTQTGSQWDGLRHWGHSKTGMYYNGTHHDELLKSSHLGTDRKSAFTHLLPQKDDKFRPCRLDQKRRHSGARRPPRLCLLRSPALHHLFTHVSSPHIH